jgi:predicted peptidase
MKWFAVLILIMAVRSCDQPPGEVDGFVARQYSHSGKTIPYRLFIPPDYDTSQQYPVVLWLHGAGGVGTDNTLQIKGDQIPGTRIWTKPVNLGKHPAFVVVPQTSDRWPASQLSMVPGILESLKSELPIDPNRMYVLGQSIGGEAAWKLVTDNPHLFAAAIFVCSAGSRISRASAVVDLPVWAFQGSEDDPDFVAATRGMIQAIRRAGGNPRYTEYKGAGHDIWDRVFKEPDLVEWLFAQHR